MLITFSPARDATMKTYKQLTYELRCQIYALKKIGLSQNRIGDWEIDLVIGKGHGGALVTIVERKTSFTVSMRVDDKSARSMTATTISLLQPFKGVAFTSQILIARDNWALMKIPTACYCNTFQH